ncbi:MAG TPA: hypothetical protein VFH61_04870 [Thermoleophilia bacterium]|nr:hypothetical protein [Thermoleophilia bacterium]
MRYLVALLLTTGAVGLAACGGDEEGPAAEGTAEQTTSSASAEADPQEQAELLLSLTKLEGAVSEVSADALSREVGKCERQGASIEGQIECMIDYLQEAEGAIGDAESEAETISSDLPLDACGVQADILINGAFNIRSRVEDTIKDLKRSPELLELGVDLLRDDLRDFGQAAQMVAAECG